jgi:hypothetical protein
MTAEATNIENYIRAAMTQSRRISGRELEFVEDGIIVTDPLGDKHLFDGPAPRPSVADIIATLPNQARGIYFYRDSDELTFPGLGTWKLKSEGGSVVKPVKQRFAALEALIDADPEDLAKMRSLYGCTDTDIFVFCEGETRARDVAIAFATELNLSGRSAKTYLPPEDDRMAHRITDTYEGIGAFTPRTPHGGQHWDVCLRQTDSPYGYQKKDTAAKPPPVPGGSKVVVHDNRRMAADFRRAGSRAFNTPDRRQVIVSIEIIKSRPSATILLSERAELDCTANETVDNAPWTRHNERKAARASSRPKAPRTWHQTTADVAEAFVRREAPRGFVSGKSLYFHGPVAYSVYDRNPIAAILDLPDGSSIMFTGRDSGQGGTLAGTVTSASNDVYDASKKTEMRRFSVGNLRDLFTVGDIPLEMYPSRVGRDKAEFAHPRSCSIDLDKLAVYISRRREAALEQLDEAFETSMPTFKKGGAYKSLAGVARFRDAMSGIFGVEFPDCGDVAHYAALSDDMDAKARARQDDLKARRRAEAADKGEEADPAIAPFFRIRPGM